LHCVDLRLKNLQSCCRFFYSLKEILLNQGFNKIISMLLTLHKIALGMKWCRPLAILLGITGLAGVLASLFVVNENLGHLLEPSLILTLWGMMLFSFIQLFQKIPPPVLPHDDFLTRLGTRIILAIYTLLAFLVILVSCILLWMSFRLISLQ